MLKNFRMILKNAQILPHRYARRRDWENADVYIATATGMLFAIRVTRKDITLLTNGNN